MDFRAGNAQFLIAMPWWVSCRSHRESTPARTIECESPESLTEKSQKINGYAVLIFFFFFELKLRMGCGGFNRFLFLFICSSLFIWIAAVVPWQAASTSGRKAVLHGGVILAEHFPGMLAPSAQAENSASANCDFRTQVCSWTWTPSCQCVAICHQHMAP